MQSNVIMSASILQVSWQCSSVPQQHRCSNIYNTHIWKYTQYILNVHTTAPMENGVLYLITKCQWWRELKSVQLHRKKSTNLCIKYADNKLVTKSTQC